MPAQMCAGSDREGHDDCVLGAVSTIACECSVPVDRCVVGARYGDHIEMAGVDRVHVYPLDQNFGSEWCPRWTIIATSRHPRGRQHECQALEIPEGWVVVKE